MFLFYRRHPCNADSTSTLRSTKAAAPVSHAGTRHLHEFVCVGPSPEFLDCDAAKRVRWLDLVSIKSPALFINSAPLNDANCEFCIDAEGDVVIRTLKNIRQGDELLIHYM